MLKIAICDDNEDDVVAVKKTLENILAEAGICAQIMECRNGILFLQELRQQKYDLILLDIQMPQISGFAAAEKIYEATGGDNLIFVSNEEDMVFESLRFRPFRFVRKRRLQEEMAEAIKSWLQQNGGKECLQFKVNTNVISISLSEILYMEVKSHHLYIHTLKEESKVRGSLSEFAYLVEQGRFLRPHYSYLCNLQYVYDVKRDRIVMSNGESIRISRGKFEECKNQYLRYIRKK